MRIVDAVKSDDHAVENSFDGRGYWAWQRIWKRTAHAEPRPHAAHAALLSGRDAGRIIWMPGCSAGRIDISDDRKIERHCSVPG